MPRRARTSLERLCDEVAEGGVTLVLGAGVSVSRGVPMWSALLRDLWVKVMGSPVDPTGHPFEFQFAFELVREKLARDPRLRARLRRPGKSARSARTVSPGAPDADELFAELVRGCMYANVKLSTGAPDTLGTIARILRSEFERPKRRVLRVISLNADDLLEHEIHGSGSWKRAPALWPISRESQHPRRGIPSPIPVYHVHGFLPRAPGRYADAPDTLVFTDLQYWSAVALPHSFSNRIVSHALHDSHCVFIGLSMTDVNLIRWLGIRAVAVQMDREAELTRSSAAVRRRVRSTLRRHFWVRTTEADPGGIASELLECRGVSSVVIDDWNGPAFGRLMSRAFR
jgi:hypothetical protein